MRREVFGPISGFLMVALVLFSGCTNPFGQQNVDTGIGEALSIDFRPSYNYIVGGQKTGFEVVVRNVGDREVTHVEARPYLLPWNGFSTDKSCGQNTLYPPNEELGRLGDPCTMRWDSVTVPEVTSKQTFNAGVKVYYGYTSESTVKVYALTEDMYANYRERGVDVRSIATIEYSKGPIEIQVLADSVLIYGAGGGTVPVTIKFNNLGWPKGYPQPSGASERDFLIESVKIVPDGSGITVADASQCHDVRLRGGQTGECVLKLNVRSSSQREIQTNFKITAEYTYVQTVEIPIEVSPSLS